MNDNKYKYNLPYFPPENQFANFVGAHLAYIVRLSIQGSKNNEIHIDAASVLYNNY